MTVLLSATQAGDTDQDGPSPRGMLKGRHAWIITDGAQGLITQARGIVDALGLTSEMKQVSPRGVWRTFAPWAPVAPSERLGRPGSRFAKPWPDVVIASGRQAIPYVRAIHRQAGLATYTIILQDPKTGPKTADLIWVPEHDKRRGANVITTPTSAHSFSPQRLAQLRREVPAEIAALHGPRVAVILGGKNKVYSFSDEDDARLKRGLEALGRLGASFMLTPSRRSHDGLLNVANLATQNRPRIFWDGTGDNPYPNFLAHADMLVVTADSTNMCGEAAATGKPVYIFMPSGGSAKFKRFHDGLKARGITRELPEDMQALETWDYAPLDSTRVIADEIAQRYARRMAMLNSKPSSS
ncbi:MAG: mitochondrial fission ELM1 family protein [Hyphomicrobiaceae bacterium]